MRTLLVLAALIVTGCATPSVFQMRTAQNPDTAACIANCGHLRNECVDARRWMALGWFLAATIHVENTCTAQFDHCAMACPGVTRPPPASSWNPVSGFERQQ